MGLANDLEAATWKAKQGRRRCSVCDELAHLSKGEGESLRKALDSPLGAKALSVILQKNGVAVGVPSIRLHRLEGHT